MPKLTTRWFPEYAIGVRDVDAEHQSLFRLAEKLHHAIVSGQNESVLGALLDDLIDYTCCHFAHEEQLMERIDYPYYPEHRRQHEALRSQALAMRERFTAGESGLPIELLRFVIDWLKGHTTTSDRRIGTYMRRRGLVFEGCATTAGAIVENG